VADRYKRLCLDSSVFIGNLFHEICRGIKRDVIFRYIWDKAKAGEFRIFISAITIAEVYKTKKQHIPDEQQLDEFLELIAEPFVEIVEVDRETAIKAHKLCRKYRDNKLMPNDAVQLACAIQAKCDVLLAWDAGLNSVQYSGIEIKEPEIYDRTLFTETEFATAQEIDDYDKTVAKNKKFREKAAKLAELRRLTNESDQLADLVVLLVRGGHIVAPFTSRHVRDHLGQRFETSKLNKLLPEYCADGSRVRRGSTVRFVRVSKGMYECAKDPA
jgi:predicted nucleic acid-binding protein